MKPQFTLAQPMFDFGIVDAKRTTRYWRIVFRTRDNSLTRIYYRPKDCSPSNDIRLNYFAPLYAPAELKEVC